MAEGGKDLETDASFTVCLVQYHPQMASGYEIVFRPRYLPG